LASTLLKMMNDSCMQSIIHVPVELELLSWGAVPSATASALATPIDLLSGLLMEWPMVVCNLLYVLL
jgi:hypothetical protein